MTKRVGTTIPDSMHAFLLEFARVNDMTMSQLIYAMLFEYIEVRATVHKVEAAMKAAALDSSTGGKPN